MKEQFPQQQGWAPSLLLSMAQHPIWAQTPPPSDIFSSLFPTSNQLLKSKIPTLDVCCLVPSSLFLQASILFLPGRVPQASNAGLPNRRATGVLRVPSPQPSGCLTRAGETRASRPALCSCRKLHLLISVCNSNVIFCDASMGEPGGSTHLRGAPFCPCQALGAESSPWDPTSTVQLAFSLASKILNNRKVTESPKGGREDPTPA